MQGRQVIREGGGGESDLHFLETGLQTPHLVFLETISKNKFLKKLQWIQTGPKHTMGSTTTHVMKENQGDLLSF
jgi:hypothetical protein